MEHYVLPFIYSPLTSLTVMISTSFSIYNDSTSSAEVAMSPGSVCLTDERLASASEEIDTLISTVTHKHLGHCAPKFVIIIKVDRRTLVFD